MGFRFAGSSKESTGKLAGPTDPSADLAYLAKFPTDPLSRGACKPFFAYVSFSLCTPTLPNPELAATATAIGQIVWREMDYRTEQILDVIKQAGSLAVK